MANQNVNITRGNDLALKIAVTQSGVAFDLTGSILRFLAKWAVTDADAAALVNVYSPSNGITITDAVNGKATVNIASALTNISAIPYHTTNLPYDLQLTDASTKVYTILNGLLIVAPNVTRTSP